ncbi:MAG: FHA domain-containing protein, partial [Myxococcota bacterium]
MRGLFKSWIERGRTRQSESAPVLELLAHEGDDAGQRFTVDGDEVMIGRQQEDEEQVRGILLRDPTVSSRQAVIRRQGGEWILHHLETATNPTLFDGETFVEVHLRVGSRIRMGRVLLEVCERPGIAISDLTDLFSEGSISGLTTTKSGPRPEESDEITRVRPIAAEWGRLLIERGQAAGPEDSFGIGPVRTTLGRSEASHVRLQDMGVSREHAELIFDGQQLLLVHKSRVNPTLLNGSELSEPKPVRHGDVIQLADRVVLRVQQHSPVEG